MHLVGFQELLTDREPEQTLTQTFLLLLFLTSCPEAIY